MLLALVAAGPPPAARAQELPRPSEVPIEDLLEIVFLDRNLRALDARSGGGPKERLEIGEKLLYVRSQGEVGVAITDRRILAVGIGSGSWQRTRYRHNERPPAQTFLGDRLALILSGKRFLFFNGNSLIEQYIRLDERLLGIEMGRNVGVLVTNRRALGFTPFTDGFSEIDLQLQERIEEISALSNIGTVTTSQRLLTFRAPTSSWAETDRNLR